MIVMKIRAVSRAPEGASEFCSRNVFSIEVEYMKVVIQKSDLAVSVPKNANISENIEAMKIPKLALCRGRLGLSSHIKI